jgi:hypothetical protein
MTNNIENDIQNKGILNKLLLHPKFIITINEIKKVNITIQATPKESKYDFSKTTFPPNGKLGALEEIKAIDLNAADGLRKSRELDFTGYDESILNYMTLEGDATFTAHSLVIASKEEYIPVNFLSFYFYTRSKKLKDEYPLLTHSEDTVSDSNRHYVTDRSEFLNQWSLDGSVSFIDGPLIGGNMTSYTLELVENLHKHGITPLFIVKNSDSNLVTDNIDELKNKFHSDMHWAYKFLSEGQRTNFFLYTDQYNKNNAKVFCYLKAFNLSPQRIEMHVDTYLKNKEQINSLMDLTYYLFLAHGDKKNPQVRSIAIAEKFARDILKLTDTYNIMRSSGLVPTMNQVRFGG